MNTPSSLLAAFCILCISGCKDSMMGSQRFKNPCLDCNIDKPKPLQSIERIGTQAFARDDDGKIISTDNGGLAGVQHGGDSSAVFAVQPVKLKLKNGTWIEAFRATGKSTADGGLTYVDDHRMDTDCHGVTFTNGEYWINDSEVSTILKSGGFSETTTPKPGDIGVYRDAQGNVVHSVTVTKVDPKTGAVLEVSGLGGIEMHEHVNTPADGWPDPNATIKYYTK